MSWWNTFYKNNKAIVIAAAVSIILCVAVLLKVKDEVTRFTLIMPVFAGFILFSILITADEELEDEDVEKTVIQKKEEIPAVRHEKKSEEKSKTSSKSKKKKH